MTQQWQLSGNAESVDWSDLATAGRAYADNLVGEPAVSKVMHMMADEIERLRSRLAAKTPTTPPAKRCAIRLRNGARPRFAGLGDAVYTGAATYTAAG